MMIDKERFLTDRPYATGWVMYCSLFVLGLLSVFLFVQTISAVAQLVDGKPDGTYPNSISITGEGEVSAVPDVATFDFSVSVTGATVEAAQQDAAKKSNTALAYLKENGVAEKDIKTTGVNAYPRYEYTPCVSGICPTESKVVGYDVSQSFTVTVRDIVANPNKAGDLLVGVGKAGITNISSLNFTIDDPAKLKAEARSIAIANARAQAKQMAKDLGVRLDDVISFSEDMGDYPEPYYERAAADGAMSAKAVTPELPTGENTFKSRVYVSYEIK